MGDGTEFFSSPDGLTWTNVGDLPSGDPWTFVGDLVYAPTHDRWVAPVVSFGPFKSGMAYSDDDGATWAVTETLFEKTGDTGVFSYFGTDILICDGTNFVSAVHLPQGPGSTDDQFCIIRSSDGISWTFQAEGTPPFTPTHRGYSVDLDMFIVLGEEYDPGEDFMPMLYAYSTDAGATWTRGTVSPTCYSHGGKNIVWSEDLELFVTVVSETAADSAPGNKILTSPDGASWTFRTIPMPNGGADDGNRGWTDVFETGSSLTVVGYDYDNPTDPESLATSTDAVTWSLLDIGIGDWDSSLATGGAVYAPELDDVFIYSYGTDVLTGVGFAPPAGITIDAVDPAIGDTAGGDTVEITGSGFDADVQVVFDHIFPLSVVWNSPTSITVVIPPHAPGLVDVTVTNPDDGEFDTGEGIFEYVDTDSPLGTPQISFLGSGCGVGAVDPDEGPMTGGTAVQINGQGFVAGSEVRFGGLLATDVVIDPSGTFLTCVTPAHPVGAVDVEIISPVLD